MTPMSGLPTASQSSELPTEFTALAKPGTAAKRLAKRGKSPSRTLC